MIGCKYFVELAIPATARPNARAFDATSFCRSDQSPKLLHVCIPRCAIINLSPSPQQCYQQLRLIDVVLNQFFVRTPSTRPPVNRSRPIARGGCGVCKAAAERGVCKAAPATPPVGGTRDTPKSSSIDAAALGCDRRPFCASWCHLQKNLQRGRERTTCILHRDQLPVSVRDYVYRREKESTVYTSLGVIETFWIISFKSLSSIIVINYIWQTIEQAFIVYLLKKHPLHPNSTWLKGFFLGNRSNLTIV